MLRTSGAGAVRNRSSVATPSPTRSRVSWDGGARGPATRLSLGSARASGSNAGNELTALPVGMKQTDEFMGMKVRKNFGGDWYSGRVVDIDAEIATGFRAYHVVYADGDQEHMTERELRKWLVSGRETMPGFTFASMAPAAAPRPASMGAAPPRHAQPFGDRSAGRNFATSANAMPQRQGMHTGRRSSGRINPAIPALVVLFMFFIFVLAGSWCWSCVFGASPTSADDDLNEVDIGLAGDWENTRRSELKFAPHMDMMHHADAALERVLPASQPKVVSTRPPRESAKASKGVSPFHKTRPWEPFEILPGIPNVEVSHGHDSGMQRTGSEVEMVRPTSQPEVVVTTPTPENPIIEPVHLDRSGMQRAASEVEMVRPSSQPEVVVTTPAPPVIPVVEPVHVDSSGMHRPDSVVDLARPAPKPEVVVTTPSPPESPVVIPAQYNPALWVCNALIGFGVVLLVIALSNSESTAKQRHDASQLQHHNRRASLDGDVPRGRTSSSLPASRRSASPAPTPLVRQPLPPPFESPPPEFSPTPVTVAGRPVASPAQRGAGVGLFSSPLPMRKIDNEVAKSRKIDEEAAAAQPSCFVQCSPVPSRISSPVKLSASLAPFADEQEVTVKLQQEAYYVAQTPDEARQIVKLLCSVNARSVDVAAFDMSVSATGKPTWRKRPEASFRISPAALKNGPFNLVGGRPPAAIQELILGASTSAASRPSQTSTEAGNGNLKSRLVQSGGRFRYTRELNKVVNEFGYEDNEDVRLLLEQVGGNISNFLARIHP